MERATSSTGRFATQVVDEAVADPPSADDRSEVIALLESAEPTAMAEAARALGRDLANRRHGPVEQIRRHLDGLIHAADPFVRGAGLMLEHVASAFTVAGAEVDELTPLVRAINLRAGWKRALLAMADGAARPKELAARIQLSPGRISHILAGLERAGLVERPAGSLDGRERPCRLSPLGYRVLVDLERGPAAVAIDLDAAVTAATHMLAKLYARGRASRAVLEDTLAEHLEPDAVARVAETALNAARNAGLAVISGDEAVTMAELHLQDILNDALEHAYDDDSPAIPVIDLARAKAPADGVVVVRSELHRLRWDIVIAKRELHELRLVASADWMTGEVERIVDRQRPFVMVYDSPPLIWSERAVDSPARALLGRAQQVYCYAVPGTRLPEGVQELEVA
jgi:DNA-binding MarR family transcriptional regulator